MLWSIPIAAGFLIVIAAGYALLGHLASLLPTSDLWQERPRLRPLLPLPILRGSSMVECWVDGPHRIARCSFYRSPSSPWLSTDGFARRLHKSLWFCGPEDLYQGLMKPGNRLKLPRFISRRGDRLLIRSGRVRLLTRRWIDSERSAGEIVEKMNAVLAVLQNLGS